MRAADRVRLALDAVLAHRLRSGLAALGIVIGVAATIMLAMVMQTLAASLNRQFEGLGARTLTARAETPFEQLLQGRANRLRPGDVEALRRLQPEAVDITPTLAVAGLFGGDVANGGHRTVAKIVGTIEAYARLHRVYAASGRFLTVDDDATRRKVCVLGDKTRRDLGLGPHPEGRFIQILGNWFKVVGVLEKRGSVFGISGDDDVLIPYETGLAMVPSDRAPELTIAFDAAATMSMPELQDMAARALRKTHRLAGGQADDFAIESAEQLRATFAALSARVTLGLAIVVGISLFVSGVGILNIMLVSVAERTREIGIMKALGARDGDVSSQFLLEAVLLTLSGCAVGVIAGLAGGALLSFAMPDAAMPRMPWQAVAASVASAMGVGLVFGVVPARRAAALAPAQALRHD